jgi:uncharacterized protein YceK
MQLAVARGARTSRSILISCVLLGGCGYVVLHTAARKQATAQRTAPPPIEPRRT